MNKYWKWICLMFVCVIAIFILRIEREVKISSIFLETTTTTTKSYNFIFVGDMMVARGVEKYKEGSFNYLGENIKNEFNNTDFVVGNLEGPIIENAPDIKHGSFVFAFDKEVINFLRSLNFNILSLANNHTNNQGIVGYNSTIKFLNESNINTFGHYNLCDKEASIYHKDNFYFIGFNLTFGDNGCTENILNIIKEVKQENLNNFIILYPHWGEEYSLTSNSTQQKLAHQFVDSGADLIVGSHSHVIQEIELYKNKLIFYSLGNFIFDQYFSSDTQQGLVVKLKKQGSNLVFDLVLVKGARSKLEYIQGEEKEKVLARLAKDSSEELTKMIENDKIELNNN